MDEEADTQDFESQTSGTSPEGLPVRGGNPEDIG